MSMIAVDHQDTVAIVKLSRSVTNALNMELVNELSDVLERVQHDSNVSALVLANSSDKFFSIGFDIPQLYGLPRPSFETFFSEFNRACLSLYTLPKPTIAAITGHAVAGGCILALCCDYRFIAEGKKLMGLNEIKLGVPVPYLIDCVLRYTVGTRYAREIMDTGEYYGPADSLRMGMVDVVLPLGEAMAKAVEKARLLGSWPRQAFALIKQNRVEEIEQQVLARREEKERSFVDCWYSAEARQRLKEAMEKF
jgi:enoyl-CoA hydratase/carnithine racemase